MIKGTKITMQQPRMAGFTIDSRPYEFTAEPPAQDVTNPDLMELHGPRPRSTWTTRARSKCRVRLRLYDMKTEMLTLTTMSMLVSSTGYEAG